jgi:hypothetical protein
MVNGGSPLIKKNKFQDIYFLINLMDQYKVDEYTATTKYKIDMVRNICNCNFISTDKTTLDI